MWLEKSTQYLKPDACSQTTNAFCAAAVLFIDATFCLFRAQFSNVCLLPGLFPSKERFGACPFPVYKIFLVLISCFQAVVLGGLQDESLGPKQEVVRWVGWTLLEVLFLLKRPLNFKMFMNQQPINLLVAPFLLVIIHHAASLIFKAYFKAYFKIKCIPIDSPSRWGGCSCNR